MLAAAARNASMPGTPPFGELQQRKAALDKRKWYFTVELIDYH
jgi:hypothetical protein